MADASSFKFNTADASRFYDEMMVPRLFEPWGELLLKEVGLKLGELVLDVATGPGTLARMAAKKVGKGGKVLGADISPHMLAVARSKPTVNGAPIDYVESAAFPLKAATEAYDV